MLYNTPIFLIIIHEDLQKSPYVSYSASGRGTRRCGGSLLAENLVLTVLSCGMHAGVNTPMTTSQLLFGTIRKPLNTPEQVVRKKLSKRRRYSIE